LLAGRPPSVRAYIGTNPDSNGDGCNADQRRAALARVAATGNAGHQRALPAF